MVLVLVLNALQSDLRNDPSNMAHYIRQLFPLKKLMQGFVLSDAKTILYIYSHLYCYLYALDGVNDWCDAHRKKSEPFRSVFLNPNKEVLSFVSFHGR